MKSIRQFGKLRRIMTVVTLGIAFVTATIFLAWHRGIPAICVLMIEHNGGKVERSPKAGYSVTPNSNVPMSKFVRENRSYLNWLSSFDATTLHLPLASHDGSGIHHLGISHHVRIVRTPDSGKTEKEKGSRSQ